MELRIVGPTIIMVVLAYLFIKPFHFLLLTLLIFVMNKILKYEGWNFNSGNYLFTTDTK